MRRFSAAILSGGVLAGAFGSVMGCADNESTLFIKGVAKIGDDCTYSSDGADGFLARGVYDVGFHGSYQAGLIVGNQISGRGSEARSRTETSSVVLEGAEVRLFKAEGGAFKDAFSAPGAGFVEASGGEAASFGVLSVVLLPKLKKEEVTPALETGYIIAEVKAFGRTLGGQEVESGTFRFPIDICEGCLVSFSEVEPNSALETVCRSTAEAKSVCLLGQDDVIGCSACMNSYEICQKP